MSLYIQESLQRVYFKLHIVQNRKFFQCSYFPLWVTWTIWYHIFTSFHFPVPFRNPTDNFPEDCSICATYLPKANLHLTVQWELRIIRGSPNESEVTPRASTSNQIMKGSFLSGVCGSSVPAQKNSSQPIFDSHRKPCTVGRSFWGTQETNVENNWAGSEQTDEQDEKMGYRAGSKTRSISRCNDTGIFPEALLATLLDVYLCPLLP